jgi:hypothetical protein
MPPGWRGPENVVPICPDCQSDLAFVCSWTFRGLWGYDEVRTYECPRHGPVFLTAEHPIGVEPRKGVVDQALDDSDRDSLMPVPRKPRPTLNAGAVAAPEPDSN